MGRRDTTAYGPAVARSLGPAAKNGWEAKDVTTVATRLGNLPVAFSSFIDRQSEIAKIRSLLQTARLLTLTGPAGVGKTRLALEAASVSTKTFPDVIWLVDLAPLRESTAVAGITAATLGVPNLGVQPPEVQLAEYLGERRALIVLDNCEHLTLPCAELAKALLSAAPGLHILATSRHTLGVTGEHVYTVAPLPPDEAVDLLQERAAAVGAGFEVSEGNRSDVARLCADLDRLPLAIELAAPRLRMLTVEQVTDRLEDRFRLLTGSSPTLSPHQRTLREAIGWSYELCAPAERLLWNRLSIFTGGFDLEAAEGVCAGGGIGEHEVLDLLDQLVMQSVVLITKSEGVPRYRLLESIRQYGRKKLAESGEEERLLLRHRGFFLTLAQRVHEGWFGPGQVEAVDRLRAEHTNLLAVLDHDAGPQTRLALAAALGHYWSASGFIGEGLRQLNRALTAATEPTPERCLALIIAAGMTMRGIGDPTAGDRWLKEAETLSEQLGDPALLAQVIGCRGLAAFHHGRLEESISRLEEARADLTSLGKSEATGWLIAEAWVRTYAGGPEGAEACRRVVAALAARGDRWGRAHLLLALGHTAWSHGDLEEAMELARSALKNVDGFNDHAMVAAMLELLAWATGSSGDHWQAARLLGAADALRRNVGASISTFGPLTVEMHIRCETAATASLGTEAYAQAFAEGSRHDSPSRATQYALGPAHEPATSAAATGPLTRREREVAALVAKGMSNRQIASALGLSPRTADRHVQNILGKLGFGSRAQIASWWSTTQLPTAFE